MTSSANLSFARERDHLAAVCATQPVGSSQAIEVSRRRAIATELRGALNALTLSLHVLEHHESEAQALEFAGHVANAAKRIGRLTKGLYGDERKARSSRTADTE